MRALIKERKICPFFIFNALFLLCFYKPLFRKHTCEKLSSFSSKPDYSPGVVLFVSWICFDGMDVQRTSYSFLSICKLNLRVTESQPLERGILYD